jgi:hypothetical protein
MARCLDAIKDREGAPVFPELLNVHFLVFKQLATTYLTAEHVLADGVSLRPLRHVLDPVMASNAVSARSPCIASHSTGGEEGRSVGRHQ